MTELVVAGGLYREICVWPEWNRLFGSGGRAASAVVGHVDKISLLTYATSIAAEEFRFQAEIDGVIFTPTETSQIITFEYVHSLSTPRVSPRPSAIASHPNLDASAEVVLRFGMMEGSACVRADRCVYDPQSAFDPELFDRNGSHAAHLAIVANRGEVLGLTGAADPITGAKRLLAQGVEVVVVKAGSAGALVTTTAGTSHVPAHRSERVWTIGSGDVFAAMFAVRWGIY